MFEIVRIFNNFVKIANHLNKLSFIILILGQLACWDGQRPMIKAKRLKRQAKWHRRRYLRIQKILKTSDSFENYYSLGSICLDMLSVKTQVFETDPSNAMVLQKMAFYANTGISALEKSLKFKNLNDSKKTEAYFKKAELYRKFFTPNVDDQMKYSQKAVEDFEMVIKFHQKGQEKILLKSKDAKDLLERQLKTHKKSMEN